MSVRELDHLTPQPDDGDDDAAREMGHRWVAGFNRRDAKALTELADSKIEFHPTLLAGARRTYHGHAGLHAWMEDVKATNSHHEAVATVIRRATSGDLVISGNVVLGEEPVSPFSMRFRLRDGKFSEAWAYLSDEALLASLGRLEAK